MATADDTLLIRLAREGSADAVAELFERYWPVAWQAAYAVTANRTLADDAAQDAIQRALGALDRFEDGRAFDPWVTRIAVNCAIDELRRRRRFVDEDAARPLAAATSLETALDNLGAVAAAVAALPHEKRIVVVLHYWLDFPVDEIADMLEIPYGTAASRLSRALADLREELEGRHVA